MENGSLQLAVNELFCEYINLQEFDSGSVTHIRDGRTMVDCSAGGGAPSNVMHAATHAVRYLSQLPDTKAGEPLTQGQPQHHDGIVICAQYAGDVVVQCAVGWVLVTLVARRGAGRCLGGLMGVMDQIKEQKAFRDLLCRGDAD
jgi:hypothetical protein